MKRFLVIEDNGEALEPALELLRNHGFNVNASADCRRDLWDGGAWPPGSFADIIHNAPIGIFRSTLEGRFLSVNPALARILRYDSPEELMETVNRKSIAEVLYPEPGQRREVVADILSREGWQIFEVKYRCKGGSLVTCRDYIRRVPGNEGREFELEGFVEDVTERRRTEDELRSSKELLQAIIDAAPTAIIGLDLDGRVHTVWNKAAERMLGWSAKEVMGSFLPTVPRDREEEFRRFREQIRSGKELSGVEVRRMRRDGVPIDYSIYASPLYGPDGEITGNIAVLVDISEKKRADELNRENQTRLQTMVRNAPLILYGFDKNGVFILSEGRGLAGMGLKPGEIVGRSLFDVYKDHPEAIGYLRRALAGEAFTAPLQFGDHVFDAYHEPVFGEDGSYAGTYGVVVDVTERAKAVEALRFTQFAIDKTIDQAFWMTEDGRFFYVNDAACRALGYAQEELIGMSVPDIGPTVPPEVFAAHWRDLQENGSVTLETLHRAKDGHVYPVEIRANYVVFDGKEYNCAFATDITERKEVEKALRESEEKYRGLIQNIQVAVVVHGADTRILMNNIRAQQLLGLTEKQMTGKSAIDADWHFFRSDGTTMLPEEYPVNQVLSTKRPIRNRVAGVHRPGMEEDVWVMVSADPVLDEKSDVTQIIVTFIDITKLKKAEEKISAALAEKEILLKEVHHRVKNNMQIISTLLDLQSESIHDSAALDAFRESQGRIKAMALIHEKLYESADIAFVDFQRYIEELAANLFDSYLVEPGRITIHVDAGGVTMGIDRAIPCGLIINELVTNSLKHAFPDNRQGKIRVLFRKGDDGQISLSVSDNGVGLPAGLEITSTGTLGLQLVNMLARQLRGVTRVENGDVGTTIVIEFPGCQQ
jgi:PAS domain S-box-containing protein